MKNVTQIVHGNSAQYKFSNDTEDVSEISILKDSKPSTSFGLQKSLIKFEQDNSTSIIDHGSIFLSEIREFLLQFLRNGFLFYYVIRFYRLFN